MKTIILDAKNKILGRLATQVANLLRGKDKPAYAPYKDQVGDQVVIINTDKIKVTGRKLKQKTYYHHTGYPGGIKHETLAELMTKDSREAVRRAVYGMLPKNKLRAKLIRRLKLYQGEVK